MHEAYAEDLAYIHDAGYGGPARHAAALLIRLLHGRGLTQGLVVDLGCGGGILSQLVAEAGFDVLGIDLSPAHIARARQRVPTGQFRVESLLHAEIPPCVAVATIGECVNFLFDSSNSDDALRNLFQRVHAALDERGVFLFDVAEPGRVPGGGPTQSFREEADWTVLVTAREDAGQRLLTREITAFCRVGEMYRRSHETHHLRLLPRAEILSHLRQIGFDAQLLNGYEGFTFPPGWIGFLAWKTGREVPLR